MPEFTTTSGLVVKGEVERPRKTLAEIVDIYDIIDVEDTHILIADRKKLADPDMRELGSTGSSVYGTYPREEYNATLRGKEGTILYDQMRRSSAQIRSSLRVIKTPVLGARWFVQPASDSKRDVKIAQEITDNYLNKMSMSWFQMQVEQLLCLDFGWYAFEKVFDKVDGKIIWRKFAPRHPLDHYEWEWDAHGGPEAGWFYGPAGDYQQNVNEFYPTGSMGKRIPIEKLLIFTHDKEAGDLEGISVLRSVYANWYIIQNLYKIDAIQKERHGIGIPVIKLPPGFSAADKTLANELGRNLRTNEKAHVVLPPNFILEFAKVEGQMVNSISSVDHHNKMIMNNVLAGFIDAAAQGDSKTGADMFQKGSRFIADIVRDVHNKWAIPELVRWNYGENVQPPELKVRRLGDTVDWRTMSFAIRNLIGAKLMTPSTELEDWFRDEMDLPPMTLDDKEVAQRLIDQMGLPPQVDSNAEKPGLPRQSVASKQKTVAGKNAGNDGSGG